MKNRKNHNLLNTPKKELIKKLFYKYPPKEIILDKKNKKIVFGAGRMGKLFVNNLLKKGYLVEAIIDNNPKLQGKKIYGVKIISLGNAKKYRNYPIIVASLLYETEIVNLLKKSRFKLIFPLVYVNFLDPDLFISPEYHNMINAISDSNNRKKIKKVFSLIKEKKSLEVLYDLLMFRSTTDKKYIKSALSKKRLFFEKDIMPLSENEVLVDCGAYDGDSIESFIESVLNRYKSIHSFEPDPINFRKLKAKINKNKWQNIFPVMKGVFNFSGKVGFVGVGEVDGRIESKERVSNKSSELINVVSIDEYFVNKHKPTLIKMDIEGAEMEALKGAKNTIKKYKPKLAISSYHRATDMWEIPLLIYSYNKNYKFYFRHYSNELPDTICYAI